MATLTFTPPKTGLTLGTQTTTPSVAQQTPDKYAGISAGARSAAGIPQAPINGVKAAQPGGLSVGQTNTLNKNYLAPPSDQVATGNTTNAASTGTSYPPAPVAPYATAPVSSNTGSMGALLATAQPQTSFGGIVGNLANQGQSPYNQSAQRSIYGTQGASQATYGQGIGIASQAAQQEADAIQKLQQLQTSLATKEGQIAQQPIPVEFQQGRQQALQTMYGGQEQALANEIQGLSSLYGTGAGQQATGISGLNSAGNTALTGQGTAQSALGTAGQLAQPSLGGIGTQQYYNPLTGQPEGGSQYGTGPAAAANVASIQSQTQQVNDWSAARQSAQQLGGQLTNFLQTNNVNPSDLNAVNRFLQAIGAQTSSPQYKQFQNLATDLASVYAQILTPSGGDVTNYKTQIAQSLVDSAASGQSIIKILQSLDQQAQAKIAGVQQNISTLNSGGNVNAPSSSAAALDSTGAWPGF